MLGALIGIGTSLIGSAIDNNRQKKMMEQQKENQKELNEHGQEMAMKTFNETGYEARARQMDNAGMNRGLMYGSGGGQGGTTSGGSGGSASGGQAQPSRISEGATMGLQAQAIESQIDLNKANAEKARAEAGLTGQKETTEINSRDIMIENMKQNGISQWFENMKTQALKDGADENGNVSIFENKIYGKGEQGYTNESPEMKKFQAELFKTEAEKLNVDANALLTNNKAQGYWQELLNATENKDSIRINALANKLSSEWNTGEFTNWKTWAELGLKAVQTAGSLIKGGTTINKTSTYNQTGDRINDVPTN